MNALGMGPAERALRSGVVPDRNTLLREMQTLRRTAQLVERERDEMAGHLAELMGLVRTVHGPELKPIGEMLKAENRLQGLVESWGDAHAPLVPG